MLRTDPQGLLERTLCLHTVRRRVYNVPAPNCLWHIDGNHKLIRWRIVIHGAIDGFSRLVVYLQASANNRADTVYKHFWQATQKYGIPSRVRSDKGGENRDVASFMISTSGMNRSSHIAGRSVHNQRIERLWRDVYLCVTDLFHTLFRSLESEGILSPDNDLHIFALHWVFLPRLQQHLDSFVEGWNNHPLRTERNQSPQQLWHTNSNSPASPDPPQVDELYGVDWRGPPGDRDLALVIPEVQLSRVLSQEELSRLPQQNSTNDDYGVASYIQALGLLTNWFG
ncbi:uncharacterized protein LOC125801446 [Astyanax mexicanus]|uniref:uncharacterized protein LOC125801446 n=1 Tax=Astyanax mexicanus TaxID=7994 RepID=UPI0020CB4B6B|nr:uncharacterized protein LOC125801446 [Astyanax mexicanus]